MSVSINGTSGITFNDGSIQKASAFTGFRNRIINGDCRIDQRNAGSSISVAQPSQATIFVVDRMNVLANGTGVFSAQRSSVAPAGFINSILATVTTADTSITSTDHYAIRQRIEAYNLSDLNLGTSNAKPFTISFWVRSSIAGTYSIGITNFNSTSTDRTYTADYTINSANTWEYETITIPAITSGTWGTGSNCGMELFFCLAAGSSYAGSPNTWANSPNYYIGSTNNTTSFMATNGATFYITGIQLEAGSAATDFEYRPFGTELSLCQRYFAKIASGGSEPVGMGTNYTANTMYTNIKFPVTMRIPPTLYQITGTDYYSFFRAGVADNFNSLTIGSANTEGADLYNNTEIAGTAGNSGPIRTNNSATYLGVQAEL